MAKHKKKKVVADSSLYYVTIDRHGKKVLKKKTWFSRLFDMNDNTVSASTVFMIITAAVGILLLLVPVVALLIEVIYNHTIMTDLSGMGMYIGAVSTLFLLGGFLKGWTNYSSYKYNVVNKDTMNVNLKTEEFEYDEYVDDGEPELDA